jgi:hypothetical protein
LFAAGFGRFGKAELKQDGLFAVDLAVFLLALL